jgi:hypothetical protein
MRSFLATIRQDGGSCSIFQTCGGEKMNPKITWYKGIESAAETMFIVSNAPFVEHPKRMWEEIRYDVIHESTVRHYLELADAAIRAIDQVRSEGSN